MKIIISLLSIFCISFAHADEQKVDVENPIIEEMPTDYLEFANVIGLLKPEEIIGLIGLLGIFHYSRCLKEYPLQRLL